MPYDSEFSKFLYSLKYGKHYRQIMGGGGGMWGGWALGGGGNSQLSLLTCCKR